MFFIIFLSSLLFVQQAVCHERFCTPLSTEDLNLLEVMPEKIRAGLVLSPLLGEEIDRTSEVLGTDVTREAKLLSDELNELVLGPPNIPEFNDFFAVLKERFNVALEREDHPADCKTYCIEVTAEDIDLLDTLERKYEAGVAVLNNLKRVSKEIRTMYGFVPLTSCNSILTQLLTAANVRPNLEDYTLLLLRIINNKRVIPSDSTNFYNITC